MIQEESIVGLLNRLYKGEAIKIAKSQIEPMKQLDIQNRIRSMPIEHGWFVWIEHQDIEIMKNCPVK